MADKTFIKVRRGILEPKHRDQIGESIYLFLYILDRADWKTGIIYDWRDEDVANDLGYHVQSIRNQRRKLEDGLYITSLRKTHGLQITISKWEDPREKGNQRKSVKVIDTVNDSALSVMSDTVIDSVIDTVIDSVIDSGRSPIPFNQDINIPDVNNTHKKSQVSPIQLLIERFTGIPPSNANDVKALDEIEALKPTDADVRAACDWLKNQGVIIRHYSTLVNPVRVCMAKRVQGGPMSTLEKSKAAVLQAIAEMDDE